MRAADRSIAHDTPIRFGLTRYGRTVGQVVMLCGTMFGLTIRSLSPVEER